uniref:TerC family protein n=1 Tax=Wolbachia endosymbiont of Pentidionis agamae TaxID=3110435 RepID=UPI0038CD91A4
MLSDIWILFMLTMLETILGIDNLIFISLVIDKVQRNLKNKIRILGLSLALFMRFLILFCVYFILSSKKHIF